MQRLMKLWPVILFMAVILLLGFSKDEPVPPFVTWTGSIEISDANLTFIDSNGDMVPDPNETWLVEGKVSKFDGELATGAYYCWGVFLNKEMGTAAGATAYIQRIQIDGHGTLILSGAELGTEPMVVIGGTGEFHGAMGIYTDSPITEGMDVDGDGEPEMAGAPMGLDLDGDGDNDGDGHLIKSFELLLPHKEDVIS